MGANPPNQSVRRDETIKAKKHVRETTTTMTGSDYGEPPGSPGFGFDGDLNPDFPQDGFPAALAKFVCWDILGDKKINTLNPCYIKGYQNWDYVPLNSKHAKFQMLVLTPPTSKPYDEFTIEFPGGHTTTSRWVSKVGNARAFNDFTIRGYAASWYVYAWLPLRSAVGMPPHVPGEAADQPPEHEELVQVVALPFSKEGFPLETTDGWCYLRCFELADRSDAARELGFMPTAAEVREVLGQKKGYAGCVDISQSGNTAHVVPGGENAWVALSALDGDVRVGSTQAALVQDPLMAPGTTSHLEAPGLSGGMDFHIPIAGVLTEGTGKDVIAVTFRSIIAGAQIGSYFESVQLMEAEIVVSMVGGLAATTLDVAISSGPMPKTNINWAMCHHGLTLTGNDQGGVVGKLVLPSTHVMGRELQAANIGNSPPCLYVKLASDQATRVILRGYLKVRCRGVGDPAVVDVSPPAKGGLSSEGASSPTANTAAVRS